MPSEKQNTQDYSWKYPLVERIPEGSQAVFLENSRAGIVAVTNIRLDDWGVKLAITGVQVPGIATLLQGKPVDISCCWEVLTATERIWHAPYVGWRLHLGSESVAAVIALAAEAAAAGQTLTYQEIGRAAMDVERGLRQKEQEQLERLMEKGAQSGESDSD